MFPLLETMITFAVIMLAASLFVSVLVQLLLHAGNYRSRTLTDMLRSLIHGFRVFHNDPDLVDPRTGAEIGGDPARRAACELNFVEEVLSDPILHARGEEIAYQHDPKKLSRLIDYIEADDLVAIAYNVAKSPGPTLAPARRGVEATSEPTDVRAVEVAEDDLPLPDRWVGRVPGDPARAKRYATTANFAAYVGRWFGTVEATATEHFRQRVRQLSLVVALAVVVLFNLDGIHLIGELHRNGAARQGLMTQVEALETTGTRLGIEGAPAPTPSPVDRPASTPGDLALELQKTATILDEAGVGIGWQNSWITRRYCAYTGQCAAEVAPPSIWQLVRDTAFWLAGLMFSCVMLSLGTPFWGRVLTHLVRARDVVQPRKEREAPPAEQGRHTRGHEGPPVRPVREEAA